MIILKDIVKRIDLIRKQNGMNQEQLAVELNISQPAVSKYLKERIPPPEILLKLARLGKTTIEWILTGQKSYLYNDNSARQVNEAKHSYDAEWSLAKKIALMSAETREAIITIIDHIAGHGK